MSPQRRKQRLDSQIFVLCRLISHRTGHHAFDALDDNDRSRGIIRAALDFSTTHLAE